ncbi:hypothetical protein KBT16_06710 [Nostoc sp. CCCryo 231-06]|nr:hypothetical protein [Nostoc sp. CCCryo 231-06]
MLVEAALNKACCVGVARRRYRSSARQKAERFNMAAKFYAAKLKHSVLALILEG